MSALSDRLARKIKSQMDKHGQAFTLYRHTPGTYSIDNMAPAITTTSYSVRGIPERSQSGNENGDKNLEKGRMSLASRRKITIPALDLAITPQPGDEIEFLEGKRWRVADVSSDSLHGQELDHTLWVEL